MSSEMVLQPQREATGFRPQRPILIVEDDESAAEVLAIRLERQGYQSLWTRSGQRGVELARSERPGLVLLDIRLPDADGFEACQQLDDDPDTCGIPVIILSGMERPDIIRRARAAGCRYYVRKPYDPNALLILIERSLDEAGQDELL